MSLLPVQGHPLQEPSRTKPGIDIRETPSGGGSFAKILATEAGGRGYPGSFLGADLSSQSERSPQGSPFAEIFNEHGLFCGTTPASPSPTEIVLGDTSDPVASAERSLTGRDIQNAARLSDGLKSVAATATPSSSQGFGKSDALPSQPVSDRFHLRAAPAALDAIPNPTGLQPAVARVNARPISPVRAYQGDSGTAGRTARGNALLQEYPSQGSSLNAQITLQTAEQGVSVVARLDKLTHQERVKLRTQIAALLARYGITAAEIRLNGESHPGEKL